MILDLTASMKEQEDMKLVKLLEDEYKRLKTLLVGALDHHFGTMVQFVETEGFRELIVTYKKVGGEESAYCNIVTNLGDVLKAYHLLELLNIRLESLSNQILNHIFHTIVLNPYGSLEIKSSKSNASLIITFDTTVKGNRMVSVGE
jgi:hypothetical protein